MPRFENEGFNNNRKRDVDRTVPENENYYGYSPVDFNFNSRKKNDRVVEDNQKEQGFNPCESYFSDDAKQQRRQEYFRSETPDDYISVPKRTSSAPSDKRNPNKKTNQNRNSGKKTDIKKIIKSVPIIILVLIVIAAGSLLSVMNKINYKEKTENTYVSENLMHDSSVKNILLLGVDARSNDNAETSRSDTMMLISLDSKHHCIKMVSFLRDTWVYIPSLGYEQRLNAACSSGGYEGVVGAIEYNFGIDIDGYVVADFEMFKTLVDSLGGVEVEVTAEEADEVTGHPMRYGNVTLNEGQYKLTGEQALAYCRIRKIDTDFNRTQRQRTVMSAILSKAKKSGPLKLYKMASNSAPYIETNLSKSEIMGTVFKAMGCITGDFHQNKVPFEGTWNYATIQGNSVISINTDENKQMLIDYIYNKSSADIKAEENSNNDN